MSRQVPVRLNFIFTLWVRSAYAIKFPSSPYFTGSS